ncbi:hypothetical protein D1007_32268 [Hordeum vulgare]|nr:hypothetical protein D1007_32268 [Hordeum vulgare]
MVTRWSQKSPGLKILWIWTLGTAASKPPHPLPSSLCNPPPPPALISLISRAVMITNVVRTRVNDMQMILREEDEAAGSAGSGGGSTGGGPSGERVMRDDELN